jgi:hypothetical protein
MTGEYEPGRLRYGGRGREKRMASTTTVDLLTYLYDRFNARDLEAVLATLHDDVVWANGLEGGYVHGRAGVRRYWTRQWTVIDPHVEPIDFSMGREGEVIVDVRQVVHDREGHLLSDHRVGHCYRIADGLITRFDIR